MQILDLVPTVSRLYFLERLPTSISYGQAAILLCLGLQHHQLEHVEVIALHFFKSFWDDGSSDFLIQVLFFVVFFLYFIVFK